MRFIFLKIYLDRKIIFTKQGFHCQKEKSSVPTKIATERKILEVKVCLRAKWRIRLELIPLSAA